MRIIINLASLATLALSSCAQFSQKVVGSIPPPSPETLRRPIHPALQHYYTLPLPEED